MPYKNKKDLRDYQREWIKKRKERFFKGKKCKDCGSTRNLIIHHRDPDKKDSHKIWSWAPEKFSKEIKKCDVLCESCHKHKHEDRGGEEE